MLLHLRFSSAIEREGRVDPMRDVVGVILERLGAAHDSGKRVVVAGGNGIELVIVAAGAADGEAEEGAAHGVELFIDDVHAQHAFVLFFVIGGAKREEAGGGDLATTCGGIGGWKEIACEVLGDHAIDGNVVTDGFDNVVAETPRIFEGQRTAPTGGFGETRDVEPVRGEAFGEGGG